ncbi:DUF1036 domain-containing protein [Streptomyces sp. NBC_01361]|uniref:DUF1036 domain-containing protein n=1 Tax=Streptomyces sp. NBC_01361 TaxID=2903838 RepID=UPI002E36F255|nr:DUF1036 domain-containing protein [Streptomyces sp. NBC_01361]
MLQFINSYPATVQVTIMWFTPPCDDGNWTKKGWWVIPTGHSAVAHGGDLEDINRFWCYFASGWDGNSFWRGPIIRSVPLSAFEWCEWRGGTSSIEIGYKQVDVGDSDDVIIEFKARS